MIGEPQRAFYGAQFSLTFPVLTHYGVALWVPEVGGAVDPGSEAHDLVMMLFGGMSKGERTRIQMRVRTAMAALAQDTDRFLGGRPPYGYRLADAGPHPNPAKAAAGQRAHRLEPDPVTSLVVQRIFTLYGQGGIGLRALAQQLTEEGHPSPSQHDPARNSHRDPRGWAHSALRAILENPVYGGTRTWGKQQKVEILIDPEDVAAGHLTRMRWKPRETWIEPPGKTHPALVSDELRAAVNARLQARTPGVPRPRESAHPYTLRGLLVCDVCGRRMQGAFRKPRSGDGPGRVLYRCELGKSRSVPADLAEHPATVYLREDQIVPALDAWIAKITDPAELVSLQHTRVAQDPKTAALQARLAELNSKIASLVKAIESGVEIEEVVQTLAQRKAEQRGVTAELRTTRAPGRLTAGQLAQIIDDIGGVGAALKAATPQERAAVYASLDVTARYRPADRTVIVTADLAHVAGRVGGGT